MNRIIFILIIGFVFLGSCATKVTTFFDVDRSQVIDNSNKIDTSAKFRCMATFLFYSDANSPNRYAGILVDFAIAKDSLVKIEKAEVEISPSRNSEYIIPELYTCSNLTTLESGKGKNFESVEILANKPGSDGIAMYFRTDIKQYDSLYLKLYIRYSINDKSYEIRKNITYLKGYFRQQLTR